MTSLTGCSGEAFASILRSLGFEAGQGQQGGVRGGQSQGADRADQAGRRRRGGRGERPRKRMQGEERRPPAAEVLEAERRSLTLTSRRTCVEAAAEAHADDGRGRNGRGVRRSRTGAAGTPAPNRRPVAEAAKESRCRRVGTPLRRRPKLQLAVEEPAAADEPRRASRPRRRRRRAPTRARREERRRVERLGRGSGRRVGEPPRERRRGDRNLAAGAAPAARAARVRTGRARGTAAHRAWRRRTAPQTGRQPAPAASAGAARSPPRRAASPRPASEGRAWPGRGDRGDAAWRAAKGQEARRPARRAPAAEGIRRRAANRGPPVDPDSPFAKLAALKPLLERRDKRP